MVGQSDLEFFFVRRSAASHQSIQTWQAQAQTNERTNQRVCFCVCVGDVEDEVTSTRR